jgi:hypothetical protein
MGNAVEVSVDVSIRSYQGGGSLSLRESVLIPECSFADMADLLQGFHKLAEAIRTAKAAHPSGSVRS